MKKKEEQEMTPTDSGAPACGEAQIPPEGEAEPQTAGSQEELLAEIEALKQESADLKRKWYAVTAEYENYRRRTAGDSAKRYAEGRADVVSKLFPIGDNLERAIASCTDDATRRGIELVTAAFAKILESEHISVIDPAGQPFDAEKHEAICVVDPEEGEESGTVKRVYQKGYEQGGKVLRFAQVVVVR